ncbi:MAG TPA: PEGA domain-containing protein, partial [Alphaproteobacteria bacterium]|nr:PEGA domain-containing protein [Alphaproteobacteria bacterium]
MNLTHIRRLLALVAFFIVAGLSAAQQPGTAKVQVTVSPEEAYIFIDGHPYDHRSQTLSLAPGEYTLGVYNYGYVPQVEKVTLVAGNNPAIHASLTPVTNRVSGPWGRIQIEGNPDDTAAVFLNGTTPEYFVGHIDEMNHSIWAAQQLIVPVGT